MIINLLNKQVVLSDRLVTKYEDTFCEKVDETEALYHVRMTIYARATHIISENEVRMEMMELTAEQLKEHIEFGLNARLKTMQILKESET